LFAGNPFPGKPPRFIKAVLYRYKFAKPGNPQGLYWTIDEIGDWMPVLSADDVRLVKFLEGEGLVR